jgi:hypothetical protein
MNDLRLCEKVDSEKNLKTKNSISQFFAERTDTGSQTSFVLCRTKRQVTEENGEGTE